MLLALCLMQSVKKNYRSYNMPKIHEEVVIIKFSKLVKNDTTPDLLVTNDIMDALASVVEELTGDDSIIVEVEKA